MKTKNRKILYLILIVLALVICAISIILYPQTRFLTFINTLSILGLTYLLFGLTSLVWKGGFFQGFFYSTRRFFRPKDTLYSDLEPDSADLDKPIYTISTERNQFPTPFIVTGGILFVLSLILSYI